MPYGHTLPQVTGPGHILAPDKVCATHTDLATSHLAASRSRAIGAQRATIL
jgi:hypothetical protein